MKKNKKGADADSGALEAVDIAPEALANLADRLKLDLGKLQTQSRNEKKRGKKDKEGKKEVQDKSQKEKAASNGLKQTPAQVQLPKSEKPKATTDMKQKAVSHRRKDAKLTANQVGAPKSKAIPPKQSNQCKEDAKVTVSRSSSTTFKSPALPNFSTPSSDKRQRKPNAKPSEVTTSLLDEILALGGTKEDLELVEDIDTDEDIEGDSRPTGKPKAKGQNDQTVYYMLILSSCLVTTRVAKSAQITRSDGHIP
jgi:hypothetical protein